MSQEAHPPAADRENQIIWWVCCCVPVGVASDYMNASAIEAVDLLLNWVCQAPCFASMRERGTDCSFVDAQFH